MSLLHNASALLDSFDKKRAEALFVMAVLSARRGYTSLARGAGQECIELLSRIGSETYEECATDCVSLDGVVLPDFLHEDVVRARLKSLGVKV